MRLGLIIAALLLLVQAIPRLEAQTTVGNILGTVTDPTGATVPGVSLKLVNVATSETRTGATSASGDYIFALIPPATYKLTATKNGFSTVVVDNLVVTVNQSLRNDIMLALAQVSQEINVQAGAVAVNTENATLGSVVESMQIVQLPLDGRDFLQLATLSAGVNPPATSNGQSTTQSLSGGRASLTVSVSGSREISPEFLFDGIPNKQFFYGAVGVEPPVDSLAEFKIQQGYFSPEFGAPAAINVVTKSGTNAIHGGVWEFVRNDVLDARNFFDVTKPPYRQNQFGGNVGGPAIKNKLFWFGDYEGLRVNQSGTSYYKVPTPAELSGNFSGLPPIYDPSTWNATTQTRQQFLNNQIPLGDINSFATTYNKFIPAPNSAPLAALGNSNLVGTTLYLLDDTKYDIRVDFAKSQQDTLFSRFSLWNSDQTNTSLLPGNGNISPLHSRNAVVGWTHVFSPTLVSDFRAGLDRSFLNTQTPEGAATSPNWPNQLGLTNLNSMPVCNGVPNAILANYAEFGFTLAECIITGNTNKVFSEDLSYTHGRHTLTLGGRIIRENWWMITSYTQDGSLDFTGQFTGPSPSVLGDATADYLLGDPASVSSGKPEGPTYRNAWWPDVYVNDDIKATSKLTLNLGLRWQMTPPPGEKYHHTYSVDFQNGDLIQCGTEGVPNGCISTHHADFAPRIGIAYAPAKNWAIRASAGSFYDRLPGNEWCWNSVGPPYTESYAATSDYNTPTIPVQGLFPNTAVNIAGSYLFDLADRKDPYLDQWTFSIEHTLPGNFIVQTAYVGSKGTHLSKRVDTNLDQSLPTTPAEQALSVQQRRPYPEWSFILTDEGRANSEYNGLQITLRKEYSHGFTLLSGYTWAKSLDNDSYDLRATRNYRPGDMDHGRSVFDLRNRFTASAVWDLPLGKGYAGAMKQVAQGWQVNGILSLQGGLPIYVVTPDDPSDTGATWGPRPNRVCNGNLPVAQRVPSHWFDTSCFQEPNEYTFGNGGVNYLDTDGTKSLDLAIVKNFPIHESLHLQFRAESFNSLNSVNFDAPGAGVAAASFAAAASYGVVTAAGPSREIQFALKLLW
jgi:hypothetical protein